MVDALLAGSADEVLFVVDGSDDGSYEYLVERATADDRLRPITQVNRGRPAARQRGVDEATTEVALFLDDDLVPAMDVAAAHAEEHAGTNDLVVIGAMPTTPPRWDVRARLYDQQYREIVERWTNGGDVLADLWAGHFSLRRETFRRVGGLGPVTFKWATTTTGRSGCDVVPPVFAAAIAQTSSRIMLLNGVPTAFSETSPLRRWTGRRCGAAWSRGREGRPWRLSPLASPKPSRVPPHISGRDFASPSYEPP